MADADEDLFVPDAAHAADGQDAGPQDAPEGEDEVLIGFEGEEDAPPQGDGQDSNLVRHLREQLRDRDRRLAEATRQQQPQKIEVGEKPTLAGCDYDEERFEQELDGWKGRQAQAEAHAQEAVRTQQAQQQAWQKRLGELETQKGQLGVKDYDQAAEEVKATFNEQQQAMIVRAAKNPAKMIYALGKSPAKAAELAKITDPVDFIAEVARLEGKTTVQRKSAPPPEQIVRGSAPLSKAADKEEQRLEAEAQRTGNRTKIVAYRRQKRERERQQAKR